MRLRTLIVPIALGVVLLFAALAEVQAELHDRLGR
jgi:hypothetical protein